MGGAPMSTLVCKGCGSLRPHPSDAEFVPCPCGETRLVANMAATMGGRGDLSATPSLHLNEQRDWRVRWRELQAVLERVRTPRTDDMGLEGLDSAKSDLLQLFVKIWHFKDALKAENPGGVRPLVEPFANNSADLKLIADLCNVEKHVDTQSTAHSPRSGSAYPTVGMPTARSDAQGGCQSLRRAGTSVTASRSPRQGSQHGERH